MVLDEDALEAMLERQKQKADASDAKESKQTELKEQTEEFEVYERPGADDATGKGIRSVAPSPTSTLPEAFQDDPVEESTETENATPPQPMPSPETARVPEPAPEDVQEPEPQPNPQPTPQAPPEPQSTPTPTPEPEPVPERPRVWPPLSSARNNAAPPQQASAQETVQEPEPRPEPTPTPQVPPEPQPEPTPAPEPEPEPKQVPAIDEAVDTDPHAHAELDVDGGGVRVAIVQALFNQEITDMMADLAAARAKKRGATVTHHLTVPGVYDLPLTVARLLERDDVDCAVVIGVVVQGETSHDELITSATARTLQQLSLDVDKPIGFGVTGPGMTWKQAEARVANGAHAVDAALAQVEFIKSL